MAEAEPSAAASNLASANAPDNQSVGILATARRLSKCKARTLGTAKAHLNTVEENGPEVIVGLLGDSLIERMRTTGRSDTLQSWPSDAMLSDYDMQTMNDERHDTDADPIARIQGVANFGCGGDKIENVLYRVVGDPDQDLKGLVQELHPPEGDISTRRNHRLWVIQAGTNNLNSKKGLKSEDLNALEVLLRTLYHLSRPGTKFLLTGLFYRMDIPKEMVDKANAAMQSLVANLEHEFPEASESTQQSHGIHRWTDSGVNGGDSLIARNQSQPTAQSLHHAGVQVSPGSYSPQQHVTNTSPAWERPKGIFKFLPAPRLDEFGDWLEDGVHLQQEGYRKWMRTLLPKVGEMLRRPPPPGTPERRGSHFAKKDAIRPFYQTDSVEDGNPSSG
ncbi:putative acetylhydrolase [Diaporthe ampelina]|uniref:Putative acetylhydrolase n=1 Tax=Diaporthe ampelina TaxID=1214573 RepID=A0A0G2FUX5_9PEZI|nr:putative acetylhydrolase [Diaporthe ampelina]